MEVRLYATLRALAGGRAVSVPAADGEPVGAVVERLVTQCPALAGEIVAAGGEHLLPFVNIFISGRSVRDLQGLKTPVRASDQIAIFPPVAGG